jgi:trehalose-phosphatase
MSRPLPIASARQWIQARLPRAHRLALASDFDGTLTPIADHPRHTRVSPVAHDALARLVVAPGASVAIVSGRRLADVRGHVRIPGIFLVGTGGLEIQRTGGRSAWLVPAGKRPPRALEHALAEWCARYPGAWIEDKDRAFSVHYRAVAARRQAAFVAGARRRLARGAGVRVFHGKRVFEVLPAGKWDKASALARWLGPSARGTLLVFLGDDTNDELAHALVRKRGGISIVVGHRPSVAQFRAPSTSAAAAFLAWLADAWLARAAAPAPARRRNATRSRRGA